MSLGNADWLLSPGVKRNKIGKQPVIPAIIANQFSSVQSLSRVRLFATQWITAHQASLSINNSRSSLRLTSIESVMPSSHLILCRPLLLLPSIFPSIRDFSNESVLRIRWPKYWSFSSNISPSSEHLGPISFMMDWLDLLAVQGALKSLLQHHFGYFGSKFAFPYKFKFFSSSSLEKPIFKNICDKRMISIFIKKLLRALGIIRIISPIEIRKM